MTQEIYFATSNEEKTKEAQAILGFPICIASVELEEIQSLDLAEIARHKVIQAYEKLKKPVFVEDVGFFIDAWNGFPGPFAKYLHRAVGNEGILRMLQSEKNRSIIARSIIGYHDGKKLYTFAGESKGTLSNAPRGRTVWGWDPVFIPEGASLTYAEMGTDEKNKISHRARALAQFKTSLIPHYGF